MNGPAGGGLAGSRGWADDERLARAAWSRLTEPGDREAFRFVAEHGAVAAARAVVAGEGTGVRARWRVRLPDVDPRRDLDLLSRIGGRLVVPGDDEWPAGLDDLGDRAPFCLWARGPLVAGGTVGPAVAVVGARASTAYGEHVAAEFGVGLVARGSPVVSGAAYGIDAHAHRGALAGGGPTVAILAGGVDRPYPRGNHRLIERIAAEGCLIGETPPGCAPTRWRFVQRNRLIAALTGATVVVEAALRSGTSITAREAVDLGRQVAAVPGPVTSPMSAGCHELLRAGAVCVTGADEVIELLSAAGEGIPRRPPSPSADHDGLPPDDLRVLDAVPLSRPATLAGVARVAGLDGAKVATSLALLEVRGLVSARAGGWVRRSGPRSACAGPN
jgi:DNA processing protein